MVRARRVAGCDEAGDAADRWGASEPRRMAFLGHFEHLEGAAALAHALDGCRRQNVGIGAANDHHRYAAERVKLAPQGGQRPRRTDGLEDRRELWVVVGNEATTVLFERRPREGEPVAVAPFRKQAAEPPLEGLGCRGKLASAGSLPT